MAYQKVILITRVYSYVIENKGKLVDPSGIEPASLRETLLKLSAFDPEQSKHQSKDL